MDLKKGMSLCGVVQLQFWKPFIDFYTYKNAHKENHKNIFNALDYCFRIDQHLEISIKILQEHVKNIEKKEISTSTQSLVNI